MLNISKWSSTERVPTQAKDSSSSSSCSTVGIDRAPTSEEIEVVPTRQMEFGDMPEYESEEDEEDYDDDEDLEYKEDMEDQNKGKRNLAELFVPRGMRNLVYKYDQPIPVKRSDCFAHWPCEYRNDRCSLDRLKKRNCNLNWFECLNPEGSAYRGRFHSQFPFALHSPNAVDELELCFSLPANLRTLDEFVKQLEISGRITLEADTSRLRKGFVVPNQIEIIEEYANLPIDLDLRLTTPRYDNTDKSAIPIEWTVAPMVNNLGSAAEPYAHHIVPRRSRRFATNQRATLYVASQKVLNGPVCSRWLNQSEHEILNEIRKAVPADERDGYAEVRMPAKDDATLVMPSVTGFLVVEYWKDLILLSNAQNLNPPKIICNRDKFVVVRVHSKVLKQLVDMIYKEVNKNKLFMNLKDKVTVTLLPLDRSREAIERLLQTVQHVEANWTVQSTYNPVTTPEFIVKIRISHYKLPNKATEDSGGIINQLAP